MYFVVKKMKIFSRQMYLSGT